MEITQTQLLILIGYFLGVYIYKAVLSLSFVHPKVKEVATVFIPALNLIAGLVLGFVGLAGFDMTEAIIGVMATGGTADLLKLPVNIEKTKNS